MVSQEQRNASMSRVLKAVMPHPGDESSRPETELRSALKEHVNLLQEDLRTKYDNDPGFGEEDYVFLEGAIYECQQVLGGRRALERFKQNIGYYLDYPDLDWYGCSNPDDPLKQPE